MALPSNIYNNMYNDVLKPHMVAVSISALVLE